MNARRFLVVPSHLLLAPLMLLLASGAAHGSGFALIERDAAGLGRAYAGQAAVISPSAVAFNPAALPSSGSVSLNLSHLWNHLEPEDAGTQATVPALFATSHGIGLGVYGEFGLATDYPDDWVGRYRALHSEINAVRIQLAGAHSLTPTLRAGAGLFIQRFDAELTNAVPTPAGDRLFRVRGDDTGLGWSLGLLWTPVPELGLGLAYASSVDHELRGSATTPFGSYGAKVPITTPEVVRSGVQWSPRPGLRLLSGASWTRWSQLESLEIGLSNGAELREVHHWRDTWRLDLGLEHDRGPWTWRAGTAWDQSPIREAAYRTPRLPDSDRTWLAAGLDYRTGPWTLSLGYAHLWFAGGRGEHPPVDYRTGSDILSAGISFSR
jgi:long-chain fatty acid transport protein